MEDEIIEDEAMNSKAKLSDETLLEYRNKLGLLTTQEVMKVARLGKSKVQELMDRPDFPAIKIGKCNMVKFSALEEYFSERRELRGV